MTLADQAQPTARPIVTMLNGPNLNLLGVRQPETYGSTTLTAIESLSRARAAELGLDVEFHQSNHEGVLIDAIHDARERSAGLIINPAGFTSTSIAILDALLAFDPPVVEVHLTNIHRRESFRHLSYVSKRADAIVAGAGPQGYELALQHIARLIAGR
jgi:3-dehydroquinate dehydratase-2